MLAGKVRAARVCREMRPKMPTLCLKGMHTYSTWLATLSESAFRAERAAWEAAKVRDAYTLAMLAALSKEWAKRMAQ